MYNSFIENPDSFASYGTLSVQEHLRNEEPDIAKILTMIVIERTYNLWTSPDFFVQKDVYKYNSRGGSKLARIYQDVSHTTMAHG